MKALLAASILLTTSLAVPLHAGESAASPDASQSFTSPLMPGMKGTYETLEATIEKVYAAEHNGFKSRAYVVKWKDQDVVIPDMMALSEKQVGDKLTFMVQEIELPMGGKPTKMLQFLAMDMEGLQKLGTEMLKTTGTPAPAASPEGQPSPSPESPR